MQPRPRTTPVPQAPAELEALLFEALRGDVQVILFNQAKDASALFEVARKRGIEALLLEALNCHVVALAPEASTQAQLAQEGLRRIARNQAEAFRLLEERFKRASPVALNPSGC
ncbi:hypothetical protein Mlute_00488 [Meiothermus luteus]|jgi:hypothetical protein|uniref:Uncharacterized protein n=1 Tax=Meiothermus luteus TaxID=2026184 RepID=A0A399EYN9_9DEIN|nr:hypothetical protein [Meiothermus luteus]RIH88883.1 hypothetical protein Mlute_00488 [Meiothermus luteus]RMH53882.1 MAG: hypothetical protein D6684_11205 [Deinococcota bacterium]